MNPVRFREFGHISNWVSGSPALVPSHREITVTTPYWGRAIAHVPSSGPAEVDAAVSAASTAFPRWAATPVRERSEILASLKRHIESERDDLAGLIALENGKTVEEAHGSIRRGLDSLEFAISAPALLAGESMAVGRDVSCSATREPLGVVAGITPFNFPFMIPMWMAPLAIVCGNTFVLKPSEQAPLTSMRLAELAKEAGLPDGVLNVVHGGRDAVEAIADHPGIRAVAFVGSTPAARAVYSRACASGKPALCLGGAKNVLVLMEDAELESAVSGTISSGFGSAGQRCMAASAVIAVGRGDRFLDAIVEEARGLILGKTLGPVISEAARDRIVGQIERAEREGVRVALDGRGVKAPEGFEGGYWLGPTILDGATPTMTCAREEIFGPVLTVIRTNSLESALEIQNGLPYGNAASIFTSSEAAARTLTDQARAGMIGINIGVPVPRDPFSFGGVNQSKFGHGDITGRSALDFWTNLKKVTARWAS